MKKLVATMLALITLLCLVPTVAFAATASTLDTGYGVFSYSYESSKYVITKKNVSLEIYLDGENVFTQKINNVCSAGYTASFRAADGYIIKEVKVNDLWGSASSIHSPTPKSKEYSGVLTLSSNPKIKLYLVKSCKLTVNYVYTDNSASNSDITKYTNYTKEVYPGEKFKSNEWKYYDINDARESYKASVKDGKGNDVTVEGTAISGRYFSGKITEDTTYTVTFTPANVNDFSFIDAYVENGGIFDKYAKINFKYNGYNISGNNGTGKVYIVENGNLTNNASSNENEADPSIIVKDGKTYKYSFAALGANWSHIKDVYYDSSKQNWCYTYNIGSEFDIPVIDTGRINFVYNEVETEARTLSYDANGGESAPDDETKQVEKGQSATFTVSSGVPTKENYTFMGWSTNKDNATVEYKSGSDITISQNTTLYAVWEENSSSTPEAPTYDTMKELVGSGNIKVECTVANTTHPAASYGLLDGSYTTGAVTKADGAYTYTITVNPDKYVAKYNETNGAHTLSPDTQSGSNITFEWKDKSWTLAANQNLPITFTVIHDTEVLPADKPEAPTDEKIKELVESNIQVQCTVDDAHQTVSYGLLDGSYTTGAVTEVGGAAGYTCDITVQPDKYVGTYNTTYSGHTLVEPRSYIIKLEWDKENQQWKLADSSGVPVVFTVQCATTPEETYYTVTYTDGAGGAVFANQVQRVKSGDPTPAFSGTPSRPNYTFVGWSPSVAANVAGDAVYTAQWSYNGGGSGGHYHYEPTPTAVPVIVVLPKTGDMTIFQSILSLLGLL